MSIKKLLVLAAAGLASSAALAGTVSYTAKPTPAPMVNDNTGVYIEGMAGYNRYAYKEAIGDDLSNLGSWKNGTGNWAFGAAIGYQFQRYFAAELGGIYSLKAKFTETSGNASLSLRPWYAYLAGKVSVPVYDNVTVFAKLGAGYQKLEMKDNTTNAKINASNWGPMFGAGIAYNITPAVYVDGQWLRFTGKVKNDGVQTTAPNIFLLGVGYKFAV